MSCHITFCLFFLATHFGNPSYVILNITGEITINHTERHGMEKPPESNTEVSLETWGGLLCDRSIFYTFELVTDNVSVTLFE